MKRILFLIATISWWSSLAQADGFCGNKNNAFQNGEKLTYTIAYQFSKLWIAAGEATFSVSNETYAGKPAWHIVGQGSTYKSFDRFFKVRDRYESYVNPLNMMPYKFIRNVDEGGFKILNNVTFKRELSKAVSLNGTFDIDKCTHDVVSAIYYCRTLNFNNLKMNQVVPFKIFLDDKLYDMNIRYLGKQKIKTKYGNYNAIKIKPLLIEGTVFEAGTDMNVWISDDENKIPLRVESPISVGKIVVDLKSYSGLKNTFNK